MADSKISALTDGNPAQSGDEIPIARSGANYKITAGSIASLGGDVDGPASSTDNAVARFDSTTGKLIQNSGVTIDDSNNLTLPGQADLRFADSDSSNWVAFQAPATVASNVTWTLPNADGTSGQVLSTDGSGTLSWATGGGGGLTWQSVQTTGFTAVSGNAYPCNTTSAAFTVTLPASPAAGNVITLTDYAGTWGTNNLTVSPNGGKIQGNTSNATLSTNRGSVQLVYVDSTQGWVAYSGFAVTTLPQTFPVDFLVLAGGGGGGAYAYPGGGGAGGYRTSVGTSGGGASAETALSLSVGTSYTVTVGAGGTKGTFGGTANGGKGSNSVFASITSTGGGGGVSSSATAVGGSGGGGAGGSAISSGIAGTANQGYAGGNGATDSATYANGGGGGGAGALGANATSGGGGNGGAGVSSSITGTSVTRGGGGGGGGTGSEGSGGSGGGGSAGEGGGSPGGTNLGGGGGSAGGGVERDGGAGGSGVVIIKIPDTYTATFSGGVTSSLSTAVSGYKIYTVTATSTTSETVTFS